MKKIRVLVCVVLVAVMFQTICVSAAFSSSETPQEKNFAERVYIEETMYNAGSGTLDGWFGDAGTYEADAEHGNVLRLSGKAFAGKLFGKVVDSDMLRVSYEVKPEAGAELAFCVYDVRPGSEAIAQGNAYSTAHDPYDYRQLWEGAAAKSVEFKNGNISVGVDNSAFSNKWYKVDMIYNLNNDTYTVYVDGVSKVENSVIEYDGIKGIGIDIASGSAVFDNIYVKEYVSISENEICMMADAGASELTSAGGKVYVEFSEYMNSAVTASDISVKSLFTGKNQPFDFISSNNNGFVIKLPDGIQGTYEIKVVAAGITGALSGCAANIGSYAYISAVNNISDKKYYYMNEKFENYASTATSASGAQPDNWVFGYETNYLSSGDRWPIKDSYSNAQVTVKCFSNVTNSIDGSNAWALYPATAPSSASAVEMYYYFPSSVPLNGIFTMELDIKNTKGGWMLSFVGAEDYEAAIANGVSAQNSITNLYSVGGIGIPYNTSGATELYYAKAREQALANLVTTGGTINLPSGEWTHLKADFDTYSGDICFTTSNASGNVTGTVTVNSDLNSVLKWCKGVAGLRITRNANATPSEFAVDNICVYKNNSYVLNETFDTFPTKEKMTEYDSALTEGSYPYAGGWYDVDYQPENLVENTNLRLPLSTLTAYGSDGKLLVSGSAYTDARQPMKRLQKYFNHSVRAGKAFEFNFEVTPKNTDEEWAVSMLNPSEAVVINDAINKANVLVAYKNGAWRIPKYGVALENISEENSYSVSASYTPDSVHNVKISVEPYYDNAGNEKSKITFECGSYSEQFVTEQNFMDYDTAAIALDFLGLTKVYEDISAASVLFDNFTVIENGNTTAGDMYIKSIKAVNYNDIVTDILHTDNTKGNASTTGLNIQQDIKRIDIVFSAPVSANAIELERMIALRRYIYSGLSYERSQVNPEYSLLLSADKKTVSIIISKPYSLATCSMSANTYPDYPGQDAVVMPSGANSNANHKLIISKNIEFENNASSQLSKDYVFHLRTSGTSITNTGTTSLSMAKASFVKAIDEYAYESGNIVKTGVFKDIVKPVSSFSELDENSSYKLEGCFGKRYQTTIGDETITFFDTERTAFATAAGYNEVENSKKMVNINSGDIKFNYGDFDKYIPLGHAVSDEATMYKTFLWDKASYAPLCSYDEVESGISE